MKRVLLTRIFSLSLICLFTTVSCDKADLDSAKRNSPQQNSKSLSTTPYILKFFNSGFEFIYEVSSTGSVLSSTLSVNPDHGDGFVLSQNIDSSIPAYRLMVYKSVISEAQRLIAESSISINSVLQAFIPAARALVESEHYSQEITQYILHFNAILRSAARSEVSGSACKCLPHPAYFNERSPFWCQEDIYVSPASFLDGVDSLNVLPSHSLELELIAFLNENINETEVSSNRVFAIFESESNYLDRLQNVYDHENSQNPSGLFGCWSLQGSDLGCCGNYAGCCWYSSMFCLWHDVECYECSHWHCGTGCVPG